MLKRHLRRVPSHKQLWARKRNTYIQSLKCVIATKCPIEGDPDLDSIVRSLKRAAQAAIDRLNAFHPTYDKSKSGLSDLRHCKKA
jgi:hypothetical protein